MFLPNHSNHQVTSDLQMIKFHNNFSGSIMCWILFWRPASVSSVYCKCRNGWGTCSRPWLLHIISDPELDNPSVFCYHIESIEEEYVILEPVDSDNFLNKILRLPPRTSEYHCLDFFTSLSPLNTWLLVFSGILFVPQLITLYKISLNDFILADEFILQALYSCLFFIF